MTSNLIPAGIVDQVWPAIANGIAQSVSRCDSDLTVSFLWQLCRSGNGFLILAFDETGTLGASIWRFEQYRSGMKFSCLAWCGKRMKDWVNDMYAIAKKIALDGGANGFISEGSDALVRLFPEAKKVRTLFEVKFDG